MDIYYPTISYLSSTNALINQIFHIFIRLWFTVPIKYFTFYTLCSSQDSHPQPGLVGAGINVTSWWTEEWAGPSWLPSNDPCSSAEGETCPSSRATNRPPCPGWIWVGWEPRFPNIPELCFSCSYVGSIGYCWSTNKPRRHFMCVRPMVSPH